jgi:predicted nucleotidyltransferase
MLDLKDKQVLADLKTVADALRFPWLIIGAGARRLTFDERLGVEGRATTDWDIAVQLGSWAEYQILSDRMTQAPDSFFRQTRIPHKFIHILTGTEVDLVPFGEIGQPNQQIQWPDGHQMNLLGLQEALSHAKTQTIDGVELQVLSIPAFLVLKLFAWGDRKAPKDLEDINHILKHYQDDDRVFEELSEALITGNLEFQNGAAFLLGHDIQQICDRDILIQLDLLLAHVLQNQDRLIPQFVSRSISGSEWDVDFQAIICRFEMLRHGMLEKPHLS